MFRIPDDKLKEILIQDGLVVAESFDSNLKDANRLGVNVADVLVSGNVIPRDYLERAIAKYLGIPAADLDDKEISMDILNLLSEEVSRQKRVVLFGKEEDGSISAAMEDPSDLVTVQFLERYTRGKIKPYLASENDLNKGFSLYTQVTVANFKKIIAENVEASMRNKIKGEEAAGEVPIVAIVDNLLSYAMSLRASDVHLEIFEDFILIRYRIDGVLHEMLRVPKSIHPAVVARIKILGGLRIDEHSEPQDGRFRYQVGSDIIDLRVAVMRTFYGEKVEMRLLPATMRPLSFAELGMLESTVDVIKRNIGKTYGMMLVCGPTGSGKTTTLYSVLNTLNRTEVNIVTIEDPVEYDIKFINQTQVNPIAGVTFADGLRAILRQDPDIVMVGEIRDNETADIAVQSSLTGHLVLSSIHTNDAITTVPRLMDMGIEQFLVAAVLNAILAQRLVRKIHTGCIESYEPDEGTIEAIRDQLKQIGLSEEEIRDKIPKTLYRGKGCDADNHTGYEGRIGIFETLDITEGIRKIIVSPNFSLDNMRAQARKEGMITMFEDGLQKVERGTTTIEEILRVIRE